MEINIRKAVSSDAAALIGYLETIGGESDFLTFGQGEFGRSIEEEEKFIENAQEKRTPCS